MPSNESEQQQIVTAHDDDASSSPSPSATSTTAPSSSAAAAAVDNNRQKQRQNLMNNADPILAELTTGVPVCFAGIPHAKELERQQNFLQSVQLARRLHIAIPSNGINLHLDLNHEQLVPERNEVQFVSDFYFNGTRVRLHGHIGIRSLQGKVKVELLQVPDQQQQHKIAEWMEQRMARLRAAALSL